MYKDKILLNFFYRNIHLIERKLNEKYFKCILKENIFKKSLLKAHELS